jgi:hypothetical protein
VKEPATVGSSFFGAFYSDRISKATNDIDVNVREREISLMKQFL